MSVQGIPRPAASGRAAAWQGEALRVGAVALGVVLAFAAAMPGQFADPFLRSDDYPALFGDWKLYYWKTLTEGRWVNHLWHRRPVLFQPQAVFALYMALWCLTWTLAARGLFRADRRPWRMLLAALVLAAMPQAALISAWSATLVPATALLALCAGIAAFAPLRAAIGALVVLVPLGVMSYTTYPLLMLGICVLAADWRGAGWRAVAALGAVFAVSFVLGMLAMYGLNWLMHGHFGVQLPAWRDPSPVRGLADLLGNLAAFGPWLAETLASMSLLPGPARLLAGGLVLLAALSLVGTRPSAALRLGLLAAMTLALMAAQIGYTGVETPFRGTGALWLAGVGAIALAMAHAPTLERRLVFAGAAGLVAIYGLAYWGVAFSGDRAEYQRMSRALAREVEARLGQPAPDLLLLTGTPYGLSHAHELQHGIGLQFRLEALTGAEVAWCDWRRHLRPTGGGEATVTALAPEFAAWSRLYGIDGPCGAHRAALAEGPEWPAEGAVSRIAPGVAHLRLPARDLRDTPP